MNITTRAPCQSSWLEVTLESGGTSIQEDFSKKEAEVLLMDLLIAAEDVASFLGYDYWDTKRALINSGIIDHDN
jgi:hypothetical protein